MAWAGVAIKSHPPHVKAWEQKQIGSPWHLAVYGVAVGLKSFELALHDGKGALLLLKLQFLANLAAPQLQQSVPHLILHLKTGVLQVLVQRAQ